MNADRIVLDTFFNRDAADVAASQLRANGIDCWLESDDAGGMYPTLGPVRLLVDRGNAKVARHVLDEPVGDVEFPPEADAAPSPVPSGAPRPNFLRFMGGLITGLVLGVLWHIAWQKFQDFGERKYQSGNELQIWRNGRWVESRYDRNGDNRFDFWRTPTEARSDDNFDGQSDGWTSIDEHGRYKDARFDSDFNGVPDSFVTYEHDLIKQIYWKPNGTNVVLLRQLYEFGQLREELYDNDRDGEFDISIRYDPFMQPIATNRVNVLPGMRTNGSSQ